MPEGRRLGIQPETTPLFAPLTGLDDERNRQQASVERVYQAVDLREERAEFEHRLVQDMARLGASEDEVFDKMRELYTVRGNSYFANLTNYEITQSEVYAQALRQALDAIAREEENLSRFEFERPDIPERPLSLSLIHI